MKNLLVILSLAGFGLSAAHVAAEDAAKPYKVLDTTQLMGTGGIDYVLADSEDRRVYVPRGTQTFVFDLDSHKQVGTIAEIGGHGVAIGLLLADLAEPRTGTIQVDPTVVRRLVEGGRMHPVGLRRLLTKFVAAGLLVSLFPGVGDRWGVYALALPRHPAYTPHRSIREVVLSGRRRPPRPSRRPASRCRSGRTGR